MGHSHKPGALKQSNKKHKSSSSSKRSVKRSLGNGRVDLGEGKKGKMIKPHKADLKNARNDRVNRNHQIRKNKNSSTYDAQRIGSLRGPPKVIGIICLNKLANGYDCREQLLNEASWKSIYEDTEISYAYLQQFAKVPKCFRKKKIFTNLSTISQSFKFVKK